MSLLELFCHVDDFWKTFAPLWHQTLLQAGKMKRRWAGKLTESRNDDDPYPGSSVPLSRLQGLLYRTSRETLATRVPELVSYSRFVELIPSVLVPMAAYLETCCRRCNGLLFVDSTKLAVCHNRRIK